MRDEWPDQQVEALLDLERRGLTASQMAAALNRRFKTKRSRNAVIGKLTRLAQTGGVRRVVTAVAQAPRKIPADDARGPEATVGPAVTMNGLPVTVASCSMSPDLLADADEMILLERPAAEETVDAALADGVDIMDLRSHHCRWVLPNGRFCGHKRVPGQSWCAEHLAIVFQKPPKEQVAHAEATGFWTDARVDHLLRLRAAGKPYGDIAAALALRFKVEVTRSMVAGKLGRLTPQQRAQLMQLELAR